MVQFSNWDSALVVIFFLCSSRNITHSLLINVCTFQYCEKPVIWLGIDGLCCADSHHTHRVYPGNTPSIHRPKRFFKFTFQLFISKLTLPPEQISSNSVPSWSCKAGQQNNHQRHLKKINNNNNKLSEQEITCHFLHTVPHINWAKIERRKLPLIIAGH